MYNGENKIHKEIRVRRIGVVTAGRDAPGMNAIIRSVARTAFDHNYEVIGFRNGFDGLMQNDAFVMNKSDVSGILHLGGTILGTSTGNPFTFETAIQQVKKNIQELSITNLVIIGAFKYMQRAAILSEAGIPLLGIPASIDNNIPCTDFSVGFLTAADFVASSLDRLHDTANAHHRIFLVEVMGGGAGWIGIIGGLTGGADLILVPEQVFTVEGVIHHIENRKSSGKNFSIIVISDEVQIPADLKKKVEASPNQYFLDILMNELRVKGNLEIRKLVLGHLQRGGSPNVADRLLATLMGHFAVENIRNGVTGKMITYSKGALDTVNITAIQQPKEVTSEMIALAKIFY
jgi:6-phosphofructokinase 1